MAELWFDDLAAASAAFASPAGRQHAPTPTHTSLDASA